MVVKGCVLEPVGVWKLAVDSRIQNPEFVRTGKHSWR